MELRLRVSNPAPRPYDVDGRNFDALSRAMNRRGCWGRYSFPFRFTPHGNPVERIDMTITPRIEMPRWTGYRAAGRAHQREWDRMIAALQRHEDEHHRLLVRKAEEFRDSIPNITIPMDASAVGQMMADFEREAKAVMDDFDDRTDHGRRQGVELNDP